MTEMTFATAPSITLLARNVVTDEGRDLMLEYYGDAAQDRDYEPSQAEIIEYAGRRCYDAHGRGHEKTKTSYGYIGNIMDQNHGSVLEHAVFTFDVRDISRAASHEWVRHRHGSYSQESQRYVLSTKHSRAVIPPAMLGDPNEIQRYVDEVRQGWEQYEESYRNLRDQGLDRKQASEAARFYIPNGAATNIVVTGNARYWIEFIQKRDAAGADAEIRLAAKVIGGILADELPEVFGPKARNKHWNNGSEQKAARHG